MKKFFEDNTPWWVYVLVVVLLISGYTFFIDLIYLGITDLLSNDRNYIFDIMIITFGVWGLCNFSVEIVYGDKNEKR